MHKSIKGPSSLTWFTITIENSNTSKYGTAVAKKEKEGKENNAFYRGHFPLLATFCFINAIAYPKQIKLKKGMDR